MVLQCPPQGGGQILIQLSILNDTNNNPLSRILFSNTIISPDPSIGSRQVAHERDSNLGTKSNKY